MRIAFKLAYLGNCFSGFQYQPDATTVEGELFRAFEDLGIDARNAGYTSAGRTDAGVHAFGQVIAINTETCVQPRKINSFLPENITVWASARVGDDFNPRNAKSRIYMYAMSAGNYDISAMRKAAKLIIGTHDFKNFTKKFGEGKTCLRSVYNAELRLDGDFLVFEIEGNAFTWNMVRCIITALESVGRRQRSVEWFEEMLNPEKHRERIEPAPPHGLILKDVKYEGTRFEIDDYAWRTLQSRLKDVVGFYGSIYWIFSSFVE
ncbi:MAG TPA: tRNA pseudouridine(38-40) synthase TruA [Archaeoglobaceae archaeon]|nr:tRNA pseudouridine(38-40) synthase TruA [Archaeoglobaceae archaeon]